MTGVEAHRISRRDFLAGTGFVLASGAAGIAGCASNRDALAPRGATAREVPFVFRSWDEVRAQFALDDAYLHFATFVLASHPRPVQEAIEVYRRALDEDTQRYLGRADLLEHQARSLAAEYLGARPSEIALTDSTTMGLGLLYGGLRIRAGQEVLTTDHDFYSTHEALRLQAERTGAIVRRIALYKDPAAVSMAGIVESLRGAVRPATRAIALTWVHSSTGVKLPIRQIGDMLAEINAGRDEEDRVLLCVDGVHALGVEDFTVDELGCDFLVAGCHKWLYGPRGTGLIWGRKEAWKAVVPTIPTFDPRGFLAWIQNMSPTGLSPGAGMTPGGYHSFEQRWALAEAFRFHMAIGKQRVSERIRALARQLKEGLAAMPDVRLITPMDEGLSAGIVCFTQRGLPPEDVVARLLVQHRVVGSLTPYATSYARLGPGIVNSPQEVEKALQAIASLR